MQLDIFAANLLTRFFETQPDLAPVAPIMPAVEIVPSTARLEQYLIDSGVPTIREYTGRREPARVAPKYFQVANKEFSAELTVNIRDVEDDRVGFYMNKVATLAREVPQFPYRQCLTHIATNGTSATNGSCPDGTAFFATSHTEGGGAAVDELVGMGHDAGGGGNTFGFTCATGSTASRMLFLYTGGGFNKPMYWQERKPARPDTDMETKEARKTKKAIWWIDLEGAPFLGWWWNGVNVNVTGTPTTVEIHKIFGMVRAFFDRMYLPLNRSGDRKFYMHEQVPFSESTHLCVVSPFLRTATELAVSGLTLGTSTPTGYTGGINATNQFHRSFKVVTSNELN